MTPSEIVQDCMKQTAEVLTANLEEKEAEEQLEKIAAQACVRIENLRS